LWAAKINLLHAKIPKESKETKKAPERAGELGSNLILSGAKNQHVYKFTF